MLTFHCHVGCCDVTSMFVADFGNEINYHATLIDLNNNQFDVAVEKVHGSIYLTKGRYALRDFYDICFSPWIIMVYAGLGQFQITKRLLLSLLLLDKMTY